MSATQLTQLYGALRILIPAVISATAAAGLLQGGDASALSSALAAAVPVLITLVAAVWSIIAHSKSATIARVAAMPDVKAVVAVPEIADSSTFRANDKVVTPAQAVAHLETLQALARTVSQ
jgi:hypothetical protein